MELQNLKNVRELRTLLQSPEKAGDLSPSPRIDG
jgi:hypothetical protein